MSDFDLNIDHYNDNELLELLSITNKNYTRDQVNTKYSFLKNKILTSTKSEMQKKKTCDFLEKVKNKLILNLSYVTNTSVNNITGFINENEIPENPVNTSLSSKSKNNYVDKLITIDSRFRTNTVNNRPTNYSFDLSTPVSSITTMNLISVEIPESYSITSVNNNNYYLTILIDDDTFILAIPSVYVLMQDISVENYENFLEILNANLSKIDNIHTDRCEFIIEKSTSNDLSLLKHIYFSYNIEGLSTDEIPKKIILDFTKDINNRDSKRDIRSKLGWILGFRNNNITLQPYEQVKEELDKLSIYGDLSYFENKIVARSEAPIQLRGAKYMYLIVDDFNNNKIETIVPDTVTLEGCDIDISLGGNILAKILFDSGSRFYNVDRLVTTTRKYTGPVDITKLRVALIDEFGRMIDFNRLDWSFTIKLSSTLDD